MKKETDLISVIVPIYKVENYLKKCLDSIVNQTYKNLEIILIDDGSPDNCGKICDEYAKKDERSKVIHKENEGVSIARNAGLKIASGDYIAFVDSDDWIELDMYEEMIKCAQEKNVDMVRCRRIFEYSNKSVKDDVGLSDNTFFDVKSDRLYFINLILANGVLPFFNLSLIKKEKIDNNELRFNSDLIVGEDLLFTFKLLCNIDSIYIYDNYFYHYNVHIQSAMNSITKSEAMAKNLLKLYDYIKKLLIENNLYTDDMQEKLARYIFYRIYYRIAEATAYSKTKDIINYFLNNENFNDIVALVDKNKLSIYGKIFYRYVLKRKISSLYNYCFLYSYLKRIKKGNI